MTLPKRHGRCVPAAFTLVELMVVVVIIGIMTALMIPEMKGSYEEALLRSSARSIGSAFRLAYSRAVISNHPHRVRFDSAEGKLVVEERMAEGDLPYRPLPEFQRKESQLHPEIRFRFIPATSVDPKTGEAVQPSQSAPGSSSQDEGVFTFHPDGTCEGTDIELRDRMGFGMRLRLNQVTSRLRFEPMERSRP